MSKKRVMTIATLTIVLTSLSSLALETDAKLAFGKTGYSVGDNAVALVSVTNSAGKPLNVNGAHVVFQYAGSSHEFQRALKNDFTIEKDAVWKEEIELSPFPWETGLGYYTVRLVLDTREGRVEINVPGIVLYRQDASIELLDTDTCIYSPGQAVKARVVVRNTGHKVLENKEIRFNTGAPWISQYRDKATQAEERMASWSGQTLPEATCPIPKLKPGETFDTGWVEVFRFPEREPQLPFTQFFMATINGTGGWDDIIDLERSEVVYCRPWGYDGPPVFDSHTHLWGYLHDADYEGVSHKPIDQYDPERRAGKDIARRWMGFAPHPDDEMAFAFLIPESIREGYDFHIVQMTSGDGNPWAQAVEFGRITDPNDWRALGDLRRQETMHALGHLGATEDHVTWLGMPDGGSGIIYHKHPDSSDPFMTFTTCVDRVPYAWAYKRNMPHSREAVVQACKELILKHNPTDVFCCHPDERHVDHRMSTYYVLDAIKEIREEGGKIPTVHVYVSYQAGDFAPAGFEYEPEEWGISERDAVLVHQASWSYQSQGTVASRGGVRMSPEQIMATRPQWFILKGFQQITDDTAAIGERAN